MYALMFGTRAKFPSCSWTELVHDWHCMHATYTEFDLVHPPEKNTGNYQCSDSEGYNLKPRISRDLLCTDSEQVWQPLSQKWTQPYFSVLDSNITITLVYILHAQSTDTYMSKPARRHKCIADPQLRPMQPPASTHSPFLVNKQQIRLRKYDNDLPGTTVAQLGHAKYIVRFSPTS